MSSKHPHPRPRGHRSCLQQISDSYDAHRWRSAQQERVRESHRRMEGGPADDAPLEELGVVVSLVPLPGETMAGDPVDVPADTLGTIVHIPPGADAYYVEVVKPDGRTEALFWATRDQLRPVDG